MESAWIAVIGTLGGVAVTAVAGLLTALLVGRQQRAAAERKFQHDTGQKIREERRSTFVEYLSAYDAGMGKARQVFNSRAESEPEEVTSLKPFETVADPEMARVSQAYLTITITASGETREAADECTGALWKVGNAAMSGDESAFNLALEDAHAPRRALRAAMRKELGIE